jgi:hypothetical protein
MRQRTEQGKQQADERVGDFQRSWNEHLKRARARVDARKAQHDAKVAEDDAKAAAGYAEYAIDFAYGAIEEAEYAVLATMDADAAKLKVPSRGPRMAGLAPATGHSPTVGSCRRQLPTVVHAGSGGG